MIEIAPNPSGPAHLGTLRSYVVAWRLARQRGCPVFVRFDDNHLTPHDWYSRDWAKAFLDELALLDMTPDGWEYNTQRIASGSVPVWACCREDRHFGPAGVRAFFPPLCTLGWAITPPSPELYRAGQPVPRHELPASLERVLAERQHDGTWRFTEEIVNLIAMQLRGAQIVVRALLSANIRLAESCASRWLHTALPEEFRTAVVVDDTGALSKSRLKPGDYGTVGWALERHGAAVVRAKVIASAERDARPIIHVNEILPIARPVSDH